MNAQHPDDFAPLSYGAALAVGLLLILGLPTETEPARGAPTHDVDANQHALFGARAAEPSVARN